MKQKNQAIENKAKTVVKASETDAQLKTREDNQFELGLTEEKKKDKKAKEKKATDGKEKDLSHIISSSFKNEDAFVSRDYKEKNYGKGKKKEGAKFHFNINDFPEL